ncbi:MAG: GerMN domain-containing protein [Candidatus Eremiobacteraeota bacterium]|nr:GerMN domain-containing protein [Candidatus Eremiobacteraeota bacterium]
MRSSRATFLLLSLLLIAIAAGWWWFSRSNQNVVSNTITVYYTKTDGTTEVPWTISMGPARDLRSVLFYAATQAVAGPASTNDAIRFPTGTHVLGVNVDERIADVDLSGEVKSLSGGSLGETGEFKSLVWTLTKISGIDGVRVRVDGMRLDALPGGHLELDKPLKRSDW